MKYTNEIIIDLPRERVIKLFDSIDNLPKWQKGFQKYEHISGEPGKKGASAMLTYKMRNRIVEMIETITVSNFPNEFSAIYEAKGVWNEVKNHFTEMDKNTTKWTSTSEFKFSGFMKIIGFLFPGSFKKESLKFLKCFKEFAEGEV